MESFRKPLKVERIHRVRYATRAQARRDIVDRIEGYYNRRRSTPQSTFAPLSTTRLRGSLHDWRYVKRRRGHNVGRLGGVMVHSDRGVRGEFNRSSQHL